MKKSSKTVALVRPFSSTRMPNGVSLILSVCALLVSCLLPQKGLAQGCVSQGPDLGEGLLFLEGHARPEGSRPMVSVTSDPFATRLILIANDTTRTTVQIANVDCDKTAAGTGWQGDARMWIYCKEGSSCVQDETRVGDTEQWEPSGTARDSASYVTEAGDAASTEELSRVFSHMIYLLQQRQKDMQTDAPAPAQ